MKEMIASRKRTLDGGQSPREKFDIIAQLCEGDKAKGGRMLSDREILGNLFGFIVAGRKLILLLLVLILFPNHQKMKLLPIAYTTLFSFWPFTPRHKQMSSVDLTRYLKAAYPPIGLSNRIYHAF